MARAAPPSVVMAAHFPPPVTGLSAVNARMAERLAEKNALCAAAALSGGRDSTVPRLLARLAAFAAAVWTLVRTRLAGARVLYMPLDGGIGAVFNLGLATLARGLSLRLFVHHHSFAYINRPTALMRAIIAMSPARSVHVVLCQRMGEQLAMAYGEAWRRADPQLFVLPNGFMITECLPASEPSGDRPLVIGHLSNLSASKGIETFLTVFETLLARGRDVRAVVAGPATESAVERRLIQMSVSYPSRFSWLGRVEKQTKDAFYAEIDVFLFPTEYANEAQPLVLLEALAHGCPIMSIARGCIDCDHDSSVGLITKDRAAFLADGVNWLESLDHDRPSLVRLRQAASAAGRRAIAQGSNGLELLINRMAHG